MAYLPNVCLVTVTALRLESGVTIQSACQVYTSQGISTTDLELTSKEALLCRICWQLAGTATVPTTCTSAAFPRPHKYKEITEVCQVYRSCHHGLCVVNARTFCRMTGNLQIYGQFLHLSLNYAHFYRKAGAIMSLSTRVYGVLTHMTVKNFTEVQCHIISVCNAVRHFTLQM